MRCRARVAAWTRSFQLRGGFAERAQLVPGGHAFDQILKIVLDHGVGDGLLVGEVIVQKAARHARFAGDGGHAGGGDPFGFVKLARRQHDVAGGSLKPRALPDLPRDGVRQVRIESG